MVDGVFSVGSTKPDECSGPGCEGREELRDVEEAPAQQQPHVAPDLCHQVHLRVADKLGTDLTRQLYEKTEDRVDRQPFRPEIDTTL